MKRSAAIAGVSAAMIAALAGVLPALAADGSVEAEGLSWVPSKIAVKPGETVTWHNPGVTEHTLKFDDRGEAEAAGFEWTFSRTFDQAKATPYRYICEIHAGMVGRVYVNESGTVPSPTPTPTATAGATPTATATATATATPTTTPTGTPGGGDDDPVAELRSLDLDSAHRRVRFTIELSAPAEVTGKLKRRRPSGRYKRFGTVDFGIVDAGEQELSFKRVESGKRVKPGRYKLKLSAAGETRTLKFRFTR